MGLIKVLSETLGRVSLPFGAFTFFKNTRERIDHRDDPWEILIALGWAVGGQGMKEGYTEQRRSPDNEVRKRRDLETPEVPSHRTWMVLEARTRTRTKVKSMRAAYLW